VGYGFMGIVWIIVIIRLFIGLLLLVLITYCSFMVIYYCSFCYILTHQPITNKVTNQCIFNSRQLPTQHGQDNKPILYMLL